MNIWYISKYATPVKYFFGTRHFYLAEEWVKLGNSVIVITSNSSHLSNNLPVFKGLTYVEIINGVTTVWLNTIKSKSPNGISRILSWIHFDLILLMFAKRNLPIPEVIIVSSLSLTSVIPAYLLSLKFHTKLVFEVRDIWPLSIIKLGGFNKSNLFIKILSWIEKFGYEKSNMIVGTMPNLEEHVKMITASYNRCICIPQGFSSAFYEKDQVELTEDYINKYIPKNKFIICYAGTLNSNNPLQTLIEAAKILNENTQIHFCILGSGTYKKQLEFDSRDLMNVSFPPPVKKSEVQSFLKNIHVCYDSFDSDLARFGLSRNKWIDYIYAEKPIICSYDGYKSMLNEANCGEFVKFNDAFELVTVIIKYSQMSKIDLQKIGMNGKNFLLNNRSFEKLSVKYLEEINNC